ncbi:MAG: murein transglycosylase A [Betaproteobacteria bacterium]|nr:murein transglycosylase A [Betaproteobacteria bacterium]
MALGTGCTTTRMERPTIRQAPGPLAAAPATAKADSGGAAPIVRLIPVTYADVPGWREDDHLPAFRAFLRSCPAITTGESWRPACTAAARSQVESSESARQFLERTLVPHRVTSPDGKAQGLLTGYYEPLLRGSRTPSGPFQVPVYSTPDDLVSVDLSSVAPETRKMRLRGRVVGRKILPYWSRAEIDEGAAPLTGKEIVWVDDPVDLFFLHVQGSGRVQTENGDVVRLGYADQNGHPYRSIGRLLVERGELTADQASMQAIKAWGRRHPDRLASLLAENPSYVFFRELPPSLEGPPGSMGIPLTGGRSIAVDPSAVALGAPVFIASTMPGSGNPLRRLTVAQDTGGAIKGAVRADLFWGFGPEAEEIAGRMREPLEMWVLLPRADVP